MPIPNYLRRATVGLFITGLIFLLLPPVLRLFDPTAGSFGVELLNALGVAAMLFSAVLHGALFAYEKFLPAFHAYQGESLEREGKLFENLTDSLETQLDACAATALEYQDYLAVLAVQTERRKTAQFKFIIRCVRLSFCLLSLAYLLHLAASMVLLAMTAVPGSAPAL
jgi:hypothetical protein